MKSGGEGKSSQKSELVDEVFSCFCRFGAQWWCFWQCCSRRNYFRILDPNTGQVRYESSRSKGTGAISSPMDKYVMQGPSSVTTILATTTTLGHTTHPIHTRYKFTRFHVRHLLLVAREGRDVVRNDTAWIEL